MALRTTLRALESAGMGKRERMSAVDTAWLRMDSPGNLMMIVGVYQFDGALDHQRLRSLLQSRLLTHRRFRSRVVQDASGTWWQEVDHFDIDLHLARTALPGKGSVDDLKKLVGRLAAQSLDPNRPLWQMHIVENVEGGQAMIVRIHHCIADGISLIGVLMALSSERAIPEGPRDAAESEETIWQSIVRPVTETAVKALTAAGDAAAGALHAANDTFSSPHRLAEKASNLTQLSAQVAKDAAALALMTNDSETSLKGKPSGSKVVAWNEPIPLDEVKAVGKALDCSVNDVLLACVAGALRAYLEQRGEATAGAEIRAMVPVNLRDPSQWKDLGNKFGLVPLLLPVGIANPIARVYEVRQRMMALKDSTTAYLAMGLLGVVGVAPRAVQKQALDFLARKATAVMTNVPGPQHALYLAGAHVKRMMFWVPQSGDIGVGVSILSYAGGVQFGLMTDRKLCPHPEQIIDRFQSQFEQLVAALSLLPWGERIDADEAEQWLFGPSRSKSAAQRSSGAGVESSPAEAALTIPEAAPTRLRRKASAFRAARQS